MYNRRITVMTGLLIVVFSMASCTDDAPVPEQVRPIKTMTVEEAPVGKIRKFAGIVRSIDFSQLSFEVGGLIHAIHVDIGARVEKDQKLAVLDEEPYRLKVDAARAELDKAKANIINTKAEYERQLRVFEQGAGTQSRVEQAQ